VTLGGPWPLAADTEGLGPATLALPEQVAASAGLVLERGSIDPEAVRTVLAVGLGAARLAAEALAAAVADRLKQPLVVGGTGPLPAFVGPGTLVVALSYSGETPEILAVVEAALEAGAAVLAVTSGGTLAARAMAAGGGLVRLAPGLPRPRAGLGALVAAPLVALDDLGLAGGAAGRLARAADQLARRRDQLLTPASPALVVARRLGRTIPLVHGAEGLGAVAAQRWRSSVNLNAKAPAFAAWWPALAHDEVAGWGQDGDVTRQVFTLVTLRHDHEPPGAEAAFAEVASMVDEVVADLVDVRAEGDGVLAQFFDLVLLGDAVSLLLAAREGLDPGPVPAVDRLAPGGGEG
jgi:glucose/mannose-6-phosphate isomerase